VVSTRFVKLLVRLYLVYTTITQHLHRLANIHQLYQIRYSILTWPNRKSKTLPLRSWDIWMVLHVVIFPPIPNEILDDPRRHVASSSFLSYLIGFGITMRNGSNKKTLISWVFTKGYVYGYSCYDDMSVLLLWIVTDNQLTDEFTV